MDEQQNDSLFFSAPGHSWEKGWSNSLWRKCGHGLSTLATSHLDVEGNPVCNGNRHLDIGGNVDIYYIPWQQQQVIYCRLWRKHLLGLRSNNLFQTLK
jgi:hypothetical protein